ncbi:MAG: hypothetical protein JWQ04_2821 [Pedosphaera sp.]|nr:hypothetical protein [Pedosphaera sp.]
MALRSHLRYLCFLLCKIPVHGQQALSQIFTDITF